jgi:hypothetical protein
MTTCPVWGGKSVSYVRVQTTGKCPEMCYKNIYILAIVGRSSVPCCCPKKKGFEWFFTIIIDVYRSWNGRSMEYDDEAAALLFII